MHFKEYRAFDTEHINEASIFDKLTSWMNNIATMFSNPQTIQSSVEATVTEAGQAGIKQLNPKSVKSKETYFIMMGDGKDAKTNFSLSLTKLADLPDGSGLFQITGTTNEQMLKALTGTNVIEDLTKNNVMALVSDKSFISGKPITIKIVKNIMPQGNDYVSKFLVTGIAPGVNVEKTYQKNKK